MEVEANTSGQTQAKTKFCKHCGGTIPQDAVMCTHCGRQVEKLAGAAQPQVVIQNTNMNTNTAAAVVAGVGARAKNKWTAFVLCLLLGYFGVTLARTNFTRERSGWAYFICLRWAFLGSDGLSTLSFCSQNLTRIMFRAAPLYRVKMFLKNFAETA